MKQLRPNRWRSGFTLIEVLLTVSIIGILGTMVLASANVARGMARDAQRVVNLNQIATAIALYENDSGGVPPGEEGVEYVNGSPEWIPGLVPKYIRMVPSDPVDSNDQKFHYVRQGNNYEVIAFLEQYGNSSACGDGGPSGCRYYEKATGEFLVIANPGASGWRFASSTSVVVDLPPQSPPPSGTTTMDTISPSAPINLSASAVSSSTISLSWLGSTDTGSANISASGYKVYRGGAVVAEVISTPNLANANTISFAASEGSLSPGTNYSYFVVAYDAVGNVSAQSGSASATTQTLSQSLPPASANLPAPTGLKPGFGIGGTVNEWVKTAESLSFNFDAASLSQVGAFRLYQKRPQDPAPQLVAEFSNPSSLTPCSARRTYGTWFLAPINGTSCPGSAWHIGRANLQPVSNYTVGDYLYYIKAVDASGNEGPASRVGTSTLLAPFAIQSPTLVQSPVSLNPTFTWPVVSGWPRTPAYWIAVAPSDGTGQIWWSSLYVYGSTGLKVYDGPALDPNKEYATWIYGHSHNSDQSEDHAAFASGKETFRVSAPVASTTP